MTVTLGAWLDDGHGSWEVWISWHYVISLYDSHYAIWRRFANEPLVRGLMASDVRRWVAESTGKPPIRLGTKGETYSTEWG